MFGLFHKKETAKNLYQQYMDYFNEQVDDFSKDSNISVNLSVFDPEKRAVVNIGWKEIANQQKYDMKHIYLIKDVNGNFYHIIGSDVYKGNKLVGRFGFTYSIYDKSLMMEFMNIFYNSVKTLPQTDNKKDVINWLIYGYVHYYATYGVSIRLSSHSLTDYVFDRFPYPTKWETKQAKAISYKLLKGLTPVKYSDLLKIKNKL